jgi:UDP-2-acetamido-2-deoxy-ribo-hexuluronate aminotransferase
MPEHNIQMVDLKGQYLKIRSEIDEAIRQAIESMAFINGPDVKSFQTNLETYLGVKRVIPCANGTDALQIALMALGLEPGDEVIVPSFTYAATAEVIALLKLKPVWTEVDEQRFTMDAGSLERAISSRTRAIIPVHLYGQCADMNAILQIAAHFSLPVIEDTAQALGADFTVSQGITKKAGTMGTIGTTSFFPSKHLGAFGDAGAIFTQDEALGIRIHKIANHGQSKKYYHEMVGVNSRLDSIQAAILNVKLKYLDQYIAARREAAAIYDRLLKDIPQVAIPHRSEGGGHSFHQYTIRVPQPARDKLKEHLDAKGIPAIIYYPVPLHLQQAYATSSFPAGIFPVTEALCGSILSLPMHTELDEGVQEYIAGEVRAFFSK